MAYNRVARGSHADRPVRSSDPNLNAAAEASQDGLQREQLEELEVEHRFYKWGAAVLALGFVIQFLHELAHYLQH